MAVPVFILGGQGLLYHDQDDQDYTETHLSNE